MTDARRNPRNERPVSLHPLTPAEALRRAMKTPAPKEDPKNTPPRKPRKRKMGPE